MTEKLTIILEGAEYQATIPFTVGQLQDLRVAVVLPEAADPQEEVKRDFTRSIEILVAALQPEHPELTIDKLRSMRMSLKEMNTSVTAILEASGLVVPKDGAAGEAQAETASA